MSAYLGTLIVVVLSFGLTFSLSAEIRGRRIIPLQKTNSAEKVSPATTNSLDAKQNSLLPTLARDAAVNAQGYTEVGFDKLAGFTFTMPEGVQPTNAVATNSATQIPTTIKAFDDKKVALKGFMLPLKVDDGVVTEMLIMKDQSMCCYGAMPRINDWVSVKMKNGGVKSVMDRPVILYGKLHVGEIMENGYLIGIYELDGDKMEEPND